MSQCVKSVQAHNGRVSALSYMPVLDRSNVSLVMSAHKSISKSKLRWVHIHDKYYFKTLKLQTTNKTIKKIFYLIRIEFFFVDHNGETF